MKWLVLGLIVAPQMGAALSCAPSTLAGDFLAENARGEPFSILVGKINRPSPEYGGEDSFGFSGQFGGHAMMPDGELVPYRAPVQIEGQCINGDCGWLGGVFDEQIVFAYERNGVLVVPVFPCSAVPAAATPENVAQLQACLTGGTCGPPEWEW